VVSKIHESIRSSKLYTGYMMGNIREGPGTFLFPDGSIYNGEWRNDRANGWGELRHINGDIYEGNWKD